MNSYKLRVLLVDDNKTDVIIIEKMLMKAFDEVLVNVKNIAECIELIKKNRFDVIVLNQIEQDVSSIENIKTISSYLPETPIIILLDNENEEYSLKLIRAGAQDYLVKSYCDKEILRRSIINSIERIQLFNKITEKDELIDKEKIKSQKYLDIVNTIVVAIDEKGNVSLINEKGASILGYSENEIIGENWFESFIPPAIKNEMFSVFKELMNENVKPVEYHENQILTKDKEIRIIAWHNTILKDDNGKLVGTLSSGEDITERLKTENILKRKFELEKTVSIISSRFINSHDIDENINKTLKDIGQFSQASRTYVFLLNNDKKTFSNTHEWCNRGVSPQIENLQNLPKDMFPWWMAQMENNQIINIENVDQMPKEASAEKEILKNQGIHSLIVLPLLLHNKASGFIGFDNVIDQKKWTGEDIAILRIISDIIERALENKKYEDQIKTSLNEKEILLKEIHHRVKNNMQLISSMLGLQMSRIIEKKDIELFRDSQNRIKTMSMIHEKLYQSDNLSKIKFLDFVTGLLESIYQSHNIDNKRIKSDLQIDNINMGVDYAIPCGLIINELFSNALKHAFNDKTNGIIKIIFEKDAQSGYTLTVIDNGIGIPKDSKSKETDTLGLRLVKAFVSQIKGTLDIKVKNGTSFFIKFKGEM